MPTYGGSTSGFSTGTAPAVVSLSGIPDGAWMIASLMQAGSYQTALPPVGWQNLLSTNSQQSGTRAQAYAGKIKTSSDTSLSWGPEFAAQAGGRRLLVLWGEGSPAPVSEWTHGLIGVRGATNVVTGQSIQAGTDTTSIAPGVAVSDDETLVISVLSEATSNAGTFSITSGSTQVASTGDAGTIEFLVAGTNQASTGTTASVVATGSQVQALNGQGLQIAIPKANTAGTPVKLPDGGTAYLSYVVGGDRKSPSRVRPVHRGFSGVAEMLATPGFTWAHRGLTTYAEESLYAYTEAVLRGHGGLELSMGRTSDGVWFGSHDNNLNRVTASTGLPNIASMTWAQVQALTINIGIGAPQPFMRWEELRDTYGQSHVLILDPKNFNWGAYQAEFLDMCDELGPDRVIVKQYASDVPLANAAAARGYMTWGHTFDDFMSDPNLSTYLAAWTMLGIDYASPQADWDVLLATGKKVIGHVADNQAAYNTSISKGASGVQCTSASIAPVSWWTSP